jgi:uncharacterized protein YraI
MKIQGLLLLVLASLACGVQSTLPVYENTAPAPEMSTVVNSVTSTPETAQIVGSWNFREAPGESSPLIDTLTNEEVKLIRCKPYEGGQWCKIQSGGVTGWVNKKGLK